ncbi:MAG: BLUF domain-containing protein [Caulobacterales bacterium]|nr:BLUF domain-containing protein [Caulobacterales bacterium]
MELYRAVFVSATVGSVGQTTLSIAQILGAAERNNRRDHITGVMLFHGGRVLQAIEGRRVDLDRLMARLRADLRHTDLNILATLPIEARRFEHPMSLCGLSPVSVERRLNGRSLSEITAAEAEDMLASCIVAPAAAA